MDFDRSTDENLPAMRVPWDVVMFDIRDRSAGLDNGAAPR